MFTLPYSNLIFGGIDKVKELYVADLRAERESRKLSPEDLDEIIALGPEWPRIREVEVDPTLFDVRLLVALWDIPLKKRENQELIKFSNDPIMPQIDMYLADQKHLEEALDGFKKYAVVQVNVIIKTGNDDVVRKTGSPNMVPKIVLARLHVQTNIWSELGWRPMSAS